MIDLDEVREAFAAYRGLGKHQIDVMIEEIQQLRAVNAELVAVIEDYEQNGPRITKGDMQRLERARAAIARAKA